MEPDSPAYASMRQEWGFTTSFVTNWAAPSIYLMPNFTRFFFLTRLRTTRSQWQKRTGAFKPRSVIPRRSTACSNLLEWTEFPAPWPPSKCRERASIRQSHGYYRIHIGIRVRWRQLLSATLSNAPGMARFPTRQCRDNRTFARSIAASGAMRRYRSNLGDQAERRNHPARRAIPYNRYRPKCDLTAKAAIMATSCTSQRL